MREVSKDKLLIVVTHNFEEVEFCATRHIRVFDGSIESDRTLTAAEPIKEPAEKLYETAKRKNRGKKSKDFRNGLQLGFAIFGSRPRLSAFLCLLMIIGTMGIFFMTSISGDAAALFDKSYMFNHIDGRVVFTKQNGAPMSAAELSEVSKKYGAEKSLHYDVLLDSESTYAYFPRQNQDEYNESLVFNYTYDETFGERYIGKYPKEANEVFLSLPISYQTFLGKDTILRDKLIIDYLEYKVVGVHYYRDNNITPKCLFTEEGFNIATAVRYLATRERNINLNSFTVDMSNSYSEYFYEFVPSFAVEKNKIYVSSEGYRDFLKNAGGKVNTELSFSSTYYNYDYYYGAGSNSIQFSKVFTNEHLTSVAPKVDEASEWGKYSMYISPYLLSELASEVLGSTYRQASLFFESDSVAEEKAELMKADGYIAVPSNTTYSPDTYTLIFTFITAIFSAIMWVFGIVFLGFFINLCSGRALEAFKGDMAIMRSMGIGARSIKIGMYVRMLIALIPAYIVVIGAAALIFTIPIFNANFTYLYWWQYLLIFIGVLLLTYRVTKKQIGRLFGESVKKSLRGGSQK